MLGYCCSIANTMDSDDSRSINSTEGKTSFIGSVWSVNNMDNGPRVEYEPDKMWFDYQALFDKTKSVVLEQNMNIEVKHTNFKENELARHAVFGRDIWYSASLDGIINGELESLYTAMIHCKEYSFGYKEEYETLSQEYSDLVDLNYRYFLGICVSLCDYSSSVMQAYRDLTYCYLPKSVTTKNIYKINFKEVIDAYSWD